MSSDRTFIPKNFQPPLPVNQLILKEKASADAVPLDVLFVGGGPAGLAGAIELARLVKADPSVGSVEIGVLDKAKSLGEHNLSGAVLNPRSLRQLFPDLKDSDFPFFKSKIEKERVYFLTNTGKIRLPTPPPMHNKGNYAISICELVRWLGSQAEALGINLLTGFPAQSLLVDDRRVIGVRTTPTGLTRDGQPSGRFEPATDLTAQVVVLSEGTRGSLTQAYREWQNIKSPSPQIYALGVKELWRVKKPLDHVIHTLGWPLPTTAFGGSWCYPMGADMVSVGLVAGLDCKNPTLDVHGLLQQMLKHSLFTEILDGGELLEWGAKTIPEGGYYAFPERFSGDGVVMCGDAAGFVNVAALKGIHYAIESGRLAAHAIFDALKAKDTSAASLSKYDQSIKISFVYNEMYKGRNFRGSFKSGFWSGMAKVALQTMTGGQFPNTQDHESDADAERIIPEQPLLLPGTGSTGLSKVDGVFRSGNATRDDIPKHLLVVENVPPAVAEFYEKLCPAGVYERKGDHLVINAPNCVDCKATDVVGPRWMPREGGSGPKYRNM